MKTVLLVGLGNPGKKYEKTRHNAGFLFVDYFREKFQEEFGFSDWKLDKKLKSEISVGKISGSQEQGCTLLRIFKTKGAGYKPAPAQKIILLKPQTFMNLSGEAVAAAKKYYKFRLEDIVVAQDEIDLTLGKYKISIDSTSAGHNGVQNVIDMLGTKNFTRLRIGVDNRGDKKIPTEKYVLGKLTSAEMKMIPEIFCSVSDDLTKII